MKRISERWGAPVDVEFIWRAGEDLPTIVQIRPAKVPEGN